jgi:hypothetical protein
VFTERWENVSSNIIQGSIPRQFVWDLRWTDWHLDGFFSE